jgi:hypothetical protein
VNINEIYTQYKKIKIKAMEQSQDNLDFVSIYAFELQEMLQRDDINYKAEHQSQLMACLLNPDNKDDANNYYIANKERLGEAMNISEEYGSNITELTLETSFSDTNISDATSEKFTLIKFSCTPVFNHTGSTISSGYSVNSDETMDSKYKNSNTFDFSEMGKPFIRSNGNKTGSTIDFDDMGVSYASTPMRTCI